MKVVIDGDPAADLELTEARTFSQRFLGLTVYSHLPVDRGLFFRRCRSIHMFFMRFPIDVVFLDRAGRVVRICESLKPWSMAFAIKADTVIELAANVARARGFDEGCYVQIIDAADR